MMKYLKKILFILRDSYKFLCLGSKKKLTGAYLKALLANFAIHLNKFHHYLNISLLDHVEQSKALHDRTKGLHALLPNPENFSYSILIALDQPKPNLFKIALTSACMQTAPNMEIVIGSKTSPSEEILKIIREAQDKHPNRIKWFDCSTDGSDAPLLRGNCKTPGPGKNTLLSHFAAPLPGPTQTSMSPAVGFGPLRSPVKLAQNHHFCQGLEFCNCLLNLLAEKSTGKFLLILDQEDRLRSDLLFRYEQVLRMQPSPDKTVINCAENPMNDQGHPIPSFPRKKNRPQFPYIFQSPFDLRGLLIPKTLWDQTGGIRKDFAGAENEDLLLRLDLAGANFESIPLPLYYRRLKAKKPEIDIKHFLKALEEYAEGKRLDWTFEQGYISNSVRAIPEQKAHQIQVIIPFKDQKDLTMRCIASVLKQKGVTFQITAVDNGSQDTSIASQIESLGGEVFRVDEPFNYSRLNNLAIARAQNAKACDLVLFLNNDVELDENALSEMVRWIDQPSIGMVGARLHYPNGMLQHGGVRLDEHFDSDQLHWEHIEKLQCFEEMQEAKVHSIMDAVTAACALIKKETFLKVGGFDEIWYPIGFSDTHLAMKLKKIGLYSFYTPYAFGVHHESISRKFFLEDVENSRWWHERYFSLSTQRHEGME
jgi:O-antigen biosynthesis protein